MKANDRLTAVDLRDLSEAEHAALRQQAITLGIPLSEYFRQLVEATAKKLIAHAEVNPKHAA